jgi:hypothetical protein
MSTRGNGKIMSVMVEGYSSGRMGQFTKATGRTTLPAVREGSSMLTEMSLWESGWLTGHREKVVIN